MSSNGENVNTNEGRNTTAESDLTVASTVGGQVVTELSDRSQPSRSETGFDDDGFETVPSLTLNLPNLQDLLAPKEDEEEKVIEEEEKEEKKPEVIKEDDEDTTGGDEGYTPPQIHEMPAEIVKMISDCALPLPFPEVPTYDQELLNAPLLTAQDVINEAIQHRKDLFDVLSEKAATIRSALGAADGPKAAVERIIGLPNNPYLGEVVENLVQIASLSKGRDETARLFLSLYRVHLVPAPLDRDSGYIVGPIFEALASYNEEMFKFFGSQHEFGKTICELIPVLENMRKVLPMSISGLAEDVSALDARVTNADYLQGELERTQERVKELEEQVAELKAKGSVGGEGSVSREEFNKFKEEMMMMMEDMAKRESDRQLKKYHRERVVPTHQANTNLFKQINDAILVMTTDIAEKLRGLEEKIEELSAKTGRGDGETTAQEAFTPVLADFESESGVKFRLDLHMTWMDIKSMLMKYIQMSEEAKMCSERAVAIVGEMSRRHAEFRWTDSQMAKHNANVIQHASDLAASITSTVSAGPHAAMAAGGEQLDAVSTLLSGLPQGPVTQSGMVGETSHVEDLIRSMSGGVSSSLAAPHSGLLSPMTLAGTQEAAVSPSKETNEFEELEMYSLNLDPKATPAAAAPPASTSRPRQPVVQQQKPSTVTSSAGNKMAKFNDCLPFLK